MLNLSDDKSSGIVAEKIFWGDPLGAGLNNALRNYVNRYQKTFPAFHPIFGVTIPKMNSQYAMGVVYC